MTLAGVKQTILSLKHYFPHPARISIGLSTAITMFCCSVAFAQDRNASKPGASPILSTTHNITGFWTLRFDSFNIPKASLVPSITKKQIDAHEESDQHTIRWCQFVGTPFMMSSTAPIDIVEGATQIEIVSQTPSAPRHIYTDRTSRPDPAIFDKTTNGFSVGHWDGDTLIVETEGFNEKGHTSLPGGGFRTPASHLTERYQLVDSGRELEVTFTWTDPKVFAKPHTYAFRYYRYPREFNAGEFFCDSNEQERADFLTKPSIEAKSTKVATGIGGRRAQ
jgi:hypothetical protein